MKFNIIYQDEAIVVVNKPPDFLTVPDRFAHKLPNLYNILQAKFGEIFIVHRIDKETSGIICFARTAESHKELCRQFEEREAGKVYWVLVQGILQEKEGVIDEKLAKTAQNSKTIIFFNGRVSLIKRKNPFPPLGGADCQQQTIFQAPYPILYPRLISELRPSEDFRCTKLIHRKQKHGPNLPPQKLWAMFWGQLWTIFFLTYSVTPEY